MECYITATKERGVALHESPDSKLEIASCKRGVNADAVDDHFQICTRKDDIVAAFVTDGDESLCVMSFSKSESITSKKFSTKCQKFVFNDSEKVKSLRFSPKGTYLAVFAKFDKEVHTGTDGVGSQNARCLKVDDFFAADGAKDKVFAAVEACGGGCVLKLPTLWPCWRWTRDEKLCCKAFVAGVNVHEAHPGGTFKKLEAKSIGGFALSNTDEESDGPSFQSHFISVFIPEVKGAAAKCLVYALDGGDMKQPVNQKAFYNASSCTMKWSPVGCKNPP